jgi:hypothetical protein
MGHGATFLPAQAAQYELQSDDSRSSAGNPQEADNLPRYCQPLPTAVAVPGEVA